MRRRTCWNKLLSGLTASVQDAGDTLLTGAMESLFAQAGGSLCLALNDCNLKVFIWKKKVLHVRSTTSNCTQHCVIVTGSYSGHSTAAVYTSRLCCNYPDTRWARSRHTAAQCSCWGMSFFFLQSKLVILVFYRWRQLQPRGWMVVFQGRDRGLDPLSSSPEDVLHSSVYNMHVSVRVR